MFGLKYTPGAKPGKPINLKRTCTTESEKTEKRKKLSKEYEKDKRPVREFDSKWEKGRPWLKYNKIKNTMTCSYCIQFIEEKYGKINVNSPDKIQKNQFLYGSNNFRTSSLHDHETTKLHQQAVDRHLAKVAPTKTEGYKCQVALLEKQRKQLDLKFRNIHAIVMKNRPLSDFTWLTALDKAKGLEVGESHSNPHAATSMLGFISETHRESIVEMVQKSKFFSLTMDGSTDDATIEQETLFIRTCINGKLFVKFLCVGEPNSTSSQELYQFVNSQLKSTKIYEHMTKCVGFGSDGAANMLGIKGGLVTLLKQDFPSIIGIHCLLTG